MLPTVFSGGDVDFPAISRLVDDALAQGVDGLAIMGLAAEVRCLSPEERSQVVEAAVRAVGGRCPTLVGVSADDTPTACRLAAEAASFGADLLMVAPPAVAGLTADQQVEHFTAVASAARGAMIMLQDAPNELGVMLQPETIIRIVERAPNVRYAKLEGHNTGQAVSDLLATDVGRHLTFFGGTGGLHYLDLLDAGVTGVIPAFEAPAVFREITRRYRMGDREGARALHLKLMPFLVFKAQSLPLSVLAVKEVLAARGIIGSAHARIAPPLRSWSRKIALRHAEAAGLLSVRTGSQ